MGQKLSVHSGNFTPEGLKNDANFKYILKNNNNNKKQ